MNAMTMNRAIAEKFPSAVIALHNIDPHDRITVDGLPISLSDDALQALRSFQHDTIVALADCMAVCAADLEKNNRQVTPEELKRQAQMLRDYAETLLPRSAAEEAVR